MNSTPSTTMFDQQQFRFRRPFFPVTPVSIAPRFDGSFPSAQLGPRRIGYGLPCVKCKTYYAADLSVCPVCKTEERVSPVCTGCGQRHTERSGNCATRARRCRAGRRTRTLLARIQSPGLCLRYRSTRPRLLGESLGCSLEANHQGGIEPATVCQGCYARLQERVDLLEAALHMDLIEATRVIYEAVWSDPSDPSKTYQNAARAVLSAELRKRAGISAVSGAASTPGSLERSVTQPSVLTHFLPAYSR